MTATSLLRSTSPRRPLAATAATAAALIATASFAVAQRPAETKTVVDPVASAKQLQELAEKLSNKEAPIATALRTLGEDVRVFDMHISTLANPFMDGRVPGSKGMEVAKSYMEYWFRQANVKPAFTDEEGKPTFRQPFPLGQSLAIEEQRISIPNSAPFAAGSDFVALGLGASGSVSAKAVFCGYGIDQGLNGYRGFADGDDLAGKIAIVFRFEPMTAEGKSQFAKGRRPWSTKASFNTKLRDLARRNASAVIIINPPESLDPRANRLTAPNSVGDSAFDGPVLQISIEAGERLLADLSGTDQPLLAWRQRADEGRVFEEFAQALTVSAKIEQKRLFGENVGAFLKGSGALADEVIVMGAHLDHLGMGYFGSRSGPGELHPGADDNASGCAAVLMLAERLAKDYAAMPASTPRRSLLFVGFSGEESGLNGARFYANHPITNIEKHAVMFNFDMIGRITNGRLSVSGLGSAEGLGDLAKPLFERSPLNVVASNNVAPNSDHYAFYQKQVPVLFAIIADFHPEYHTPKDVGWKINRVGGVQTVHLFHDLLRASAVRTEPFVFQGRGARRRPSSASGAAAPAASRSAMKVRFGIQPGTYEEGGKGIPVVGVTPDTPAEAAGLEAGDVLVAWNGQEVTDVRAWMGMLMTHKPGDKVRVGIKRGDKSMTLEATLAGRDG